MTFTLRAALPALAAAALTSSLLSAAPAASAPRPGPDDLRLLTPPTLQSDGDPTELQVQGKERPGDRLGRRDRALLAQAEAEGRRRVTVMVATRPDSADAVAAGLSRLGASVGYVEEEVGYVRATLPTGTVERSATVRGVRAVDLDELVPLPEVRPQRAGAEAAARVTVPAPGPETPAENPYLPTAEIGAPAFVRAHPTWDGRGVTIGVVDTGVDLDHPALQETSTGERKVVDWVTATHPLQDPTWRPMLTEVTGPAFTYASRTWTAPAGTFFVNRFAESITASSEYAGDVNRDGDTNDTWGVLYRASDNAVWVDTDDDGDFTDEELRRPYRQGFGVGRFGSDDPATPVQESVPFVVELREDVDLSPAGVQGTADFVNIGIVSNAHGSHVAGIAAGHSLFGGAMDGAAPGARIVSSRACLLSGGCTNVALTEGMIDLVVNRGVDVVNMSIGGLPALNDGDNARAEIYNTLISRYGVQMFFSGGNSGAGLNTVGDPAVADSVVAVAASVSRDTWRSNYGAVVSAEQAMFGFSSRAPAEDGGFKPNLSAPGAAVSTIPLWQEGSAVPETGYGLPPGYGMFNGTSMAAPQAAGGAALLVSAGLAADVPVTPAALRMAMYSSARLLPDVPTYAQGVGRLQVGRAWQLLRRDAELHPGRYDISTRVCTPLLEGEMAADREPGIYNRCATDAGGHSPRERQTYAVTVTRRSGPAGNRLHTLSWLGDDGTFSTRRSVRLPLDRPVTFSVAARPTAGAHGAILRIDDTASPGVEAMMSAVVVAARQLAAPDFGWSAQGRIERNRTTSFFLTVPEGAQALKVELSGIAPRSQTRFLAFHPHGIGVDGTSSLVCYTHFSDPRQCDPVSRTYDDPTPGVWELVVEARRTTPYLANPYRLRAVVQGVEVAPETTEVPSATLGEPVPLEWTLRNEFAPVTVEATGGPLGSVQDARPTIASGEVDTFTVDVPEGADRLDVAIGNTSDPAADLDLYLFRNGVEVAFDADGDSEESVSLTDPAPGTYTVEVDAYAVPGGSTEYDYRDVFHAGALGTLTAADDAVELGRDASATLTGSVTARARPAEGRHLYGELVLTDPEGARVGRGAVVIRQIAP